MTQTSSSLNDRVVAALEVLLQPFVVLQPPHARAREDDELAPVCAHRLEGRDRLGAVGGVVARPGPVVGLGEVARAPPAELEQLHVALAHDQHGRLGRDGVGDDLADAARADAS